MDGGRLARLHALDLRLPEVRGHPEGTVLRQRHQLLPRLHPVADVDRPPAHDAGDGRLHLRVAQIQLSLPELGPGQLEIRLPHRESRLAGDELARSIGARLGQPRLRGLQPRHALLDVLSGPWAEADPRPAAADPTPGRQRMAGRDESSV